VGARIEAARRSLPVVAIVGRPNAGKSTLFNRIVGARRAIVDDAPGVTRDRVVARAEHGGRSFLCVDTGGFVADVPRDPAALAARVREQALAAVAEADCVVCVLDGAAGLAPHDRDTVRLLARAGKPVLFAVNKIDTPGRGPQAAEFYATGVDALFEVSAAHNRGVDDLLDAVVARLPAMTDARDDAGGTRLALLGRPNVGKSSLLNCLLGTEHALVAPEAGTTRDAVDTPVRIDGRPYVLIDTAGIRRRGRARDVLERHGAVRALDVITGKIKWEFRLQSPPWAGVLATAGGVVFGGSNEGNFYALDASTGKALWDFQTGGYIAANPISFLIDGKQHVAIAAGQALFVFGLP